MPLKPISNRRVIKTFNLSYFCSGYQEVLRFFHQINFKLQLNHAKKVFLKLLSPCIVLYIDAIKQSFLVKKPRFFDIKISRG